MKNKLSPDSIFMP